MKIFNDAASVKTIDIDGLSILVVDNLLADPQALRKMALDTHAQSKGNKNLLRVGERSEIKAGGSVVEVYPNSEKLEKKFPSLVANLAALIKEHIGAQVAAHYKLPESDAPLELQKGPYFNVVFSVPQNLPHVDAAHISSFVYLNSPSQCWGGTGIYRHLPTGALFTNQASTSLDWLAEKPLTKPLTNSTDEWALEYMIEMKFNRMVAFNGSLIHKIFWPEGPSAFKNNIKQSRLALNSFYWYR